MAGNDADREEGVEFGDVDPVLQDLSYPISKAEFVEQQGDLAVERTNSSPIAVRDLFEGTGDDTFESPDELRQSMLNLMPHETVGRQRYSDRGGKTPDDGLEGFEEESL